MDIKELKENLKKPQPHFIGEDEAYRAAILIPLIEKEDGLHILFEVRASTMRKQPGDISFPGGQVDETDATVIAAAIRETYEELGIPQESVQIVESLSPLVFSPNFVIYPIVGMVPQMDNYILSEYEVEKVFTIPLNWLLAHEPYMHSVPVQPQPREDFPYEKIAKGKDYQWRSREMEEWFYEYEGYSIWGLTARILKYFIERLK